MAKYDDLVPGNKKNTKLVNYKDYLAKPKSKYASLVPAAKPKTEGNVITKALGAGREFLLPDRGFDLKQTNTVTLKNGQKMQIPDVIGKNFSKVSTKEKLTAIGRYGAEALALPEAIGNLILSGVSKATKIGDVKDSALQKRLLDFAQPKTDGEAQTMRLLDVLGYLTPAGAVTKPAKAVADATRAKVITRKVPVASEAVTSKVPVGTPKTRQGDYAKSMGYEPIRPDSELPVIEMGTKPETTTGLPVIQIEAPTKKPFTPPGLRYEPIKEIIEQGRQAPTLLDEAAASVQPSRPQAPDLSVPPVSGETITPKLSSDIEADAIAKGVVSKYENLPEVPKMNMQEGISNASKLTVSDFERAKRIALGDESVPQGTEIGMVYEAVKQKAVKDNNWELLRDLATNPNAAPTQATRAGQVVKSFDTMSDSIDPVELMQSVAKSREKGANILKKAEKGATVKSAKESLAKSKPKKDAWVDFINNIEC